MKRPKVIALLMAPIAVVVTVGAGSAAVPSSSHTNTAGSSDSRVKEWKDSINSHANGSAKFFSTEYTAVAAGPKGKTAGSPKVVTGVPASGCNLQLVVYKDPYAGTSAAADALTSCSATVGQVKHWPVQLWRLDWWGFNLQSRVYKYKDNTAYFSTLANDHCTTGDYNTWSGAVHGDIYKRGVWYHADLSASANLYCGGT